jgi:hypothetical protein
MVFELARITYMYWLIECTSNLNLEGCLNLQELFTSIGQLSAECTPKLSFIKVFKDSRITYIYWLIECTPKPSFVKVFEFEKIT